MPYCIKKIVKFFLYNKVITHELFTARKFYSDGVIYIVLLPQFAQTINC